MSPTQIAPLTLPSPPQKGGEGRVRGNGRLDEVPLLLRKSIFADSSKVLLTFLSQIFVCGLDSIGTAAYRTLADSGKTMLESIWSLNPKGECTVVPERVKRKPG